MHTCLPSAAGELSVPGIVLSMMLSQLVLLGFHPSLKKYIPYVIPILQMRKLRKEVNEVSDLSEGAKLIGVG